MNSSDAKRALIPKKRAAKLSERIEAVPATKRNVPKGFSGKRGALCFGNFRSMISAALSLKGKGQIIRVPLLSSKVRLTSFAPERIGRREKDTNHLS